MSVHPRVIHKRRATITALPLYYSGHLLKKHRKEKDFKKYYAELRGATLFLYEDETQDTYTEKLNLEELKSMELDSPYKRKVPTIFTLKLCTEVVQLKMDNPDTGEEWRGYILTVIKKEIPSKLQLLPGQMMQLQEVLDQEKRRNLLTLCPPLPPRPSFLSASPSPPPPKDEPDSAPEVPACFFNATRQEAERMLEANPEYGAIILRPSTLANNYALTIRQLTPSGPVMGNYRLTTTNSGFVIELETPVAVSSLKDAVQYFLEKTEHRLRPYMLSQPYDTHIELSLAPSVTLPTLPKTVPKAQVAPRLRSKTKEAPLLPPKKPVDSEYEVPDDGSPDDLNELKLAQLDGELQKVLKIRRDTINATNAQEEVSNYENQTSEKCHLNTAQWTIESAAV